MSLPNSNISESLEGSIKRSLEASLQPTEVERQPSPHFYCTEAFEPDLFNQIRDHLPDSEFYGGVGGRTTNQRAKKARLILPFLKGKTDTLPSGLKVFWSDMEAYFRTTDFVQLALSAYMPYLRELRPDLINHSQFDIRFELLRDTTAYGIGVHSDHPNKVMTPLFYLSGGETTESYGTSFYVPKEDGFKCNTGRHYTYEDFNRYKTYSYAPNAALSFLRTDTSFHGVEVIHEENAQRDVMRWMLWKA